MVRLVVDMQIAFEIFAAEAVHDKVTINLHGCPDWVGYSLVAKQACVYLAVAIVVDNRSVSGHDRENRGISVGIKLFFGDISL